MNWIRCRHSQEREEGEESKGAGNSGLQGGDGPGTETRKLEERPVS